MNRIMELDFKRLIERYQHGHLSAKEKALMDEWFEALGRENQLPNWSKGEMMDLKRRILAQIEGDEKTVFIGDRQKAGRFQRRVLQNILRVAASVLLVALSYFVWQFDHTEPPIEFATLQASTSDQIKKVILADKSIVWLKGNSTLTYPEEFTKEDRRITLQGEALFEVTKDPGRPFIIQCGDLTTTVLGTSFNIKSSKNDIEVVVLSGKVSLTSENEKQGVILLPNEKGFYSIDKKQIAKVDTNVVTEKDETITALVTGTDYTMDFEDTPMEDVIFRIERKFNVKVHTTDPKIGNCLITANFTGQSLDRTMNMIAQVLRSGYEIKGSTVILRGAGCNE